MARIKRINREGTVTVGYRPEPGGREKYIVVPSIEAFEILDLHEQHARKQGRRFDPETVLEQSGLGQTQAPQRSDTPTFRAWIGGKKLSERGLYFRYEKTSESTRKSRVGMLSKWAYPYIGELPLDQITHEQIIAMTERWLVCKACAQRAEAAGLDLSDVELGVNVPPFDAACVIEDPVTRDEVSTHYLPVKRDTVIDVLKRVRSAFEVAMKRRVLGGLLNPAYGVQIPMFEDRPEDELREAFSAMQLQRLVDVSPAGLEALPEVATSAMLRPSEWGGLARGDILLPEPGSLCVRLKLSQVFINDGGNRERLRRTGKTKGSLGVEIVLTPAASAALLRHLDLYRSAPNPSKCETCRSGTGTWNGPGRNPHRACDLADDAPVFVGPDGNRLRPTWYASEIWPRMLLAAAMNVEELGFRAAPRHFRSTGATLAIEAGVEMDIVVRMGRWASREMVEKHYLRIRQAVIEESVLRLGRFVDAERGVEATDASPELQLRSAYRRIEQLEDEVARLTTEVKRLGGEPGPVPFLRVQIPSRRPSTAFSDERAVTEAVGVGASRTAILRGLGLPATKDNYRRLENAAMRFGLTLPDPYPARGPKAHGVDDGRPDVVPKADDAA